MDGIDQSEWSRTALSSIAGEREAADYLDGFIAALLAERRRESTVSEGDTQEQSRPARVSMRDELTALFTRTRPASPPDETVLGADDSAGPRESASRAQRSSALVQRFLPTAEQAPALHPLGLETVDSLLDGGFGPGLHVVSGCAGTGKTAFIEAAAWEAVASRRPVLYHALKDGSGVTRERLTATLAGILGFSTITLGTLRQGTLSVGDHARLRSLERVLQTSVLRWLTLTDTVDAYGDVLSAFIEDIRLRAREALTTHGEVPFVLIDDAERLMRASRVRPLADLLKRLDDFLVETSAAGLITMTVPRRTVQGVDGLPVQTTLSLAGIPGSPHDSLQYVDLEILTNARGGRTGTIPLVLDLRSGVFAPRG